MSRFSIEHSVIALIGRPVSEQQSRTLALCFQERHSLLIEAHELIGAKPVALISDNPIGKVSHYSRMERAIAMVEVLRSATSANQRLAIARR